MESKSSQSFSSQSQNSSEGEGVFQQGLLASGRRYRKGAHEYAAEFREDFSCQAMMQKGHKVDVLVCNFCQVMIGTRSDRIKEHLTSKRHVKLKALAEAQQRESLDSSYNSRLQTSGNQKQFAHLLNTTPEHMFGGMKEAVMQGFAQSMGNKLAEAMRSPKPPSPSSPGEATDLSKTATKVKQEWDDLPRNEPQRQRQRQSTTDDEAETKNYVVRWEAQGSIFRRSFIKLLDNEQLTDITLVCGTTMIKCHKIVLAACSDYFVQLFKQNPTNQNMMIVLPSHIAPHLNALVAFMYHGEMRVPKGYYPEFAKAAKELGLTAFADVEAAEERSQEASLRAGAREILEMNKGRSEPAKTEKQQPILSALLSTGPLFESCFGLLPQRQNSNTAEFSDSGSSPKAGSTGKRKFQSEMASAGGSMSPASPGQNKVPTSDYRSEMKSSSPPTAFQMNATKSFRMPARTLSPLVEEAANQEIPARNDIGLSFLESLLAAAQIRANSVASASFAQGSTSPNQPGPSMSNAAPTYDDISPVDAAQQSYANGWFDNTWLQQLYVASANENEAENRDVEEWMKLKQDNKSDKDQN